MVDILTSRSETVAGIPHGTTLNPRPEDEVTKIPVADTFDTTLEELQRVTGPSLRDRVMR